MMLDLELVEQLSGHFSGLPYPVELVVRSSGHERQAELLELLGDVARASSMVQVRESVHGTDTVHFEIHRKGESTGIHFQAVPGGHEFTSLVLAILHSGGLGRWPDQALQDRVRRLKGPLKLRTFISLSCTNCPEVVQALNQMALIHPDFSHSVLDGELFPAEIDRLGIQGVPAVFDGDRLIHVGKADFGELLGILENLYTSQEPGQGQVSGETALSSGSQQAPVPQATREFDVVVLGGGPAGSSAAIYTARKGLMTALVAGRIGGQVNDTLGIENLISVPHTEGPQLAANLRTHLAGYGIDILEHRKIESVTDGDLKTILLQGGEILQARQVIVATGARWRELGIAGEKEYLGKGVAFCPHCDGPFFKGRPVAVVGGGNSGVEAAIDLAGICSRVDLFEFLPELKADRVLVQKLASLANVTIHTNARTMEVLGNGSAVTGIKWENRLDKSEHQTALDGIFVQIGLVPNSTMVKDLVETNRAGEILIDSRCRTNVPGIYAAGDVSSVPFKQIVIAMGEGAKAALAAFEDRLHSS